jgi:hypothetical protein
MGAEKASSAQNSSTAGIANGPDAISTGTSDAYRAVPYYRLDVGSSMQESGR